MLKCLYLVEEGVISSFDASSVCVSTHGYFDNRLNVVSWQLAPLDDPDPDLDHDKNLDTLQPREWRNASELLELSKSVHEGLMSGFRVTTVSTYDILHLRCSLP